MRRMVAILGWAIGAVGLAITALGFAGVVNAHPNQGLEVGYYLLKVGALVILAGVAAVLLARFVRATG